MGTIKATNIEPIANNGTVTLGSSGDTFTVPSGVTVNMSSATQTGVGGDNQPYFAATMSGNQSLSQNTWTKVTFNTEVFDQGGNYDHSSNYRFTPTTAGKYFVFCNMSYTSDGLLYESRNAIYKNGSATTISMFYNNNDKKHLGNICVNNFVDMNGSSDYLEIYGRGQGDTPIIVAAETVFGAYKII